MRTQTTLAVGLSARQAEGAGAAGVSLAGGGLFNRVRVLIEETKIINGKTR